MKKILTVGLCICFISSVVYADTFGTGANQFTIDFVTIGNAGNAGDTRTELDSYGQPMASPYGCGAVSYNYRIGKYEVTNTQWNTFTTAAGAPVGDDSGYWSSAYFTGPQQPTNCVSWYEAAQFCNYLTSGDKSKGAYRFSGNNTNPGSFMGINRDAAKTAYSTVYVIPTEDEWYKAAYFKPDASGYSLYANGTNTAPVAGVDTNYNDVNGSPWDITNGTQEQNGTFDMMGNAWEWNENESSFFIPYYGVRGGSYIIYYVAGSDISSSTSGECPSSFQHKSCGFRVAAIVPEPASVLFFMGGICALFRKRSGR